MAARLGPSAPSWPPSVDEAEHARDLPGQPLNPANSPGQSHRVAGAVSCWGAADDFLGKLDAGDAPLLILHGTEDKNSYTTPAAAARLAARCREEGLAYTFYWLEGHGHSAWHATLGGGDIHQLAHEFIMSQGLPTAPRPR